MCMPVRGFAGTAYKGSKPTQEEDMPIDIQLHTLPAGPLKIAALEGCRDFAKVVDKDLVVDAGADYVGALFCLRA